MRVIDKIKICDNYINSDDDMHIKDFVYLLKNYKIRYG